jgi:hypothetical protein
MFTYVSATAFMPDTLKYPNDMFRYLPVKNITGMDNRQVKVKKYSCRSQRKF